MRSLTTSAFARNVVETFGTRILLIGVGIINSVLLARLLGPSGRGEYAVAVTIGGVGLQIVNLGLHSSNTYFVSKDRGLLSVLLGNSLLVSLGAGSILVSFAWLFFQLFHNWAPVHGSLLFFALLWTPFGLAYLLMQNLLLGIQEIRVYNIIELSAKSSTVVFIVLLFAASLISVESVFVGYLLSTIGGFVLIYLWIHRRLNYRPRTNFSVFKKNFFYGLKAYCIAFAGFLIVKSNVFFVNSILGPEQTGYYSIASTMADMVGMLPVVTGTIIFPKLSALEDLVQKWKLTRKVTLIITAFMILITFVAGLAAAPVVRILFGRSFIPAIPVFLLLLPGIIFWGSATFPLQYLGSIGLPRKAVIAWIPMLVLNITLNIYFIKHYGLLGAPTATSLTYVSVFVFFWFYAKSTVHSQKFPLWRQNNSEKIDV